MLEQQPDGGLWAAVGLKLSTVIAGAVGSFISMRFFEGLGLAERWSTVLCGWGLASFSAAPITGFFELKGAASETGIALFVGMFGMSIAAAVIRVIRETNWTELVTSILRRKGGGQ